MTQLRPFACTIRVFDPASGETIAEHVLPVDSPDAEHAAAFTPKTDGDAVRSVAFCCTAVEPRR